MPFEQYSLVRVGQLLCSPDDYDGWRINQRPPQVGDIGTLLDILQVPGLPDRYVVECSGGYGVDIWLGEFSAEELEDASIGFSSGAPTPALTKQCPPARVSSHARREVNACLGSERALSLGR
jgi:hypothetical protein